MKYQTNVQNGSNKYLMAGVTVSAALVLAKPIFPLTALAATNQYDWTKHEELDRMGGYYTSAATSASGSHLMLSVYEGGENTGEISPLFVSNNYGATWDNVAGTIDPDIRYYWTGTDISNNGQTMVAASDSGRIIDGESYTDGKIFISEDAGDTWSDKTPAGEHDWEGIVVSGDETKIVAFEQNVTDMYVSEDGGDNWTTIAVDENFANIKSVSLSDDGDTILVGGENTNPYTELFISTDDGANWQNITPGAVGELYNIRHSLTATGDKIVAATSEWDDEEDESVFISENNGADWTAITPADNPNSWSDISISDDGSVLSVLDQTQDKMYVSNDDGDSWNEEDAGQEYEDSNSWKHIDINEDGSQIIVASHNNAYTNHPIEPVTESTVTLDDAEGGKTITLTTPEGTSITCHSAVKESALDVSDIAFSYPLGLVDFCFSRAEANNEVSLVFVTNLKANEVAIRKYNPTTDQYTTITEATVTETTYQGQPALRVTYNIADNGPLDTDPDVGEVADPVGLGVTELKAPNTGLKPAQQNSNSSIALLLAGITVVTGLLIRPIHQKTTSRTTSKK